MKVVIAAVGRSGRLLEPAIADYAARASRYFSLDVVEVKEEKAARGTTPSHVQAAEGERLLKRVPSGLELVALTRTGDAWSSTRFARFLEKKAVQGEPGVAFLIGGALGLSDDVLRNASRRMRLSTCTLPHDLARLVLLEQIYRAGTILRGEPYHKGTDA